MGGVTEFKTATEEPLPHPEHGHMQQQEEKVGTATRKHDFTDIMCIRRRWRGPGGGGVAL